MSQSGSYVELRAATGWARGVFSSKVQTKSTMLKPRQKFGALLFRNDGPVRSFHPLDGSVRVDGHDKQVSEILRALQKIHMSGVQDIEAAVCEHDFLTGLLRRTNLVGNCLDGIDFCRHFYWRLERGTRLV